MKKESKIYVAGHKGLVGSALCRALTDRGYHNLILKSRNELDLSDFNATRKFFETERPEYVFMAAAKVGGIASNAKYPATYLYDNLIIQLNVIHCSYLYNVERLQFLGSSCVYPRNSPQPIREDHLLTGSLEETNKAYAIAKIAGIEQCAAYNVQYGTNFHALMPTNLFGPGDKYDPYESHVIPALIRKLHDAKIMGEKEVLLWGTGAPRREFLYSDDLADAGILIMELSTCQLNTVLFEDQETNKTAPPIINVGVGRDIRIDELATMIKRVVGFKGQISFDSDMPDGTPRKLLNIERMTALGWTPKWYLEDGLRAAYRDFLERQYNSK